MQYQEALDYLLEKLPMFQRVGQAAVKTDLTNTRHLLEHLGHPETKFPSIHIAGTNGKGSLTHMLTAILMKAGYTTGFYTSPHLLDFRERIKINGNLIPESRVIDFVETLKPTIEKIQPSFFESTVAMAFDHFAREKIDLGVIETGLGGRLDSTNVINPEVSVITNVSLDHQNMLGETLGEIAGEKAGIIKQGIPAIIGEKKAETSPVFTAKAQDLKAPLTFVSDHYHFEIKSLNVHQLTLDLYKDNVKIFQDLQCDLPGFYQASNITTAIATVESLRAKGWKISDDAVHSGLAETKKLTGLRGRWEKLQEHPLTICDIAHNEAAVKWHKEQLETYDYDRLHIVFGMTKEKSFDDILKAMPEKATYYFCEPQIPRAKDSDELKALATTYNLEGEAYDSVDAAIQACQSYAGPNDLILITGSAFVVAESLALFNQD